MTGYGAPELPDHMNGRIYDPLLGRFLSADVVVSNPGDLQEFNRYSYVKNRPLTLTDPSGFAPADALSDRAFRRGAAAAFGAEKADTMLHQKIAGEGKAAATGAFVLATAGAGPAVMAAAAEGNVAAQLLLAGTAAKGLADGTTTATEGVAELSVNPKSGEGWAKAIGGLFEAALSVFGVRDVRNAMAEAPVTSSTAASARTTAAADSADTPAPAVQRAEGEMVTARHHTDVDFGTQIMADKAIKPSRAADPLPPGVDVEVAPFGPANTASAELGAHKSGAYVEFSVPRSSLTPTPNITEASRNAARIVTDTPLPLTDPKLVNTKPWWAFWR